MYSSWIWGSVLKCHVNTLATSVEVVILCPCDLVRVAALGLCSCVFTLSPNGTNTLYCIRLVRTCVCVSKFENDSFSLWHIARACECLERTHANTYSFAAFYRLGMFQDVESPPHLQDHIFDVSIARSLHATGPRCNPAAQSGELHGVRLHSHCDAMLLQRSPGSQRHSRAHVEPMLSPSSFRRGSKCPLKKNKKHKLSSSPCLPSNVPAKPSLWAGQPRRRLQVEEITLINEIQKAIW